jgi:predicted transglutaminase-like cysteine proteinase
VFGSVALSVGRTPLDKRWHQVAGKRVTGAAASYAASLRGRGDCEDYAIAKLQMLRAAGFADRDLYLVIAKDLVRRSDHALLVVRADGRLLVLDNGTDRILDAQDAGDYRPVLTYSATAAWTHGYRRLVPPMQVAAASVAALSPSADLAR